jgi:hypothetical protein
LRKLSPKITINVLSGYNNELLSTIDLQHYQLQHL